MSFDEARLTEMYDCLLLDLDGTVYRGSSPTPGAIETLGAVSCRKLYLTNNAARSAAEVAGHLQTLGLSVDSGDVVTSACSAARAAAARLPAGARVLVVGTDSLAAEIARAGLHPVPTLRRYAGHGHAGSFSRYLLVEPSRGSAGHPEWRNVDCHQR